MENRIPIEFSSLFYLYAALVLLLVPLPWVVSAVVAVMIHELGHLAALRLCRVSVLRITIGINGAKIHTGYQSTWDQLICAATGPLSGIFAAFFLKNLLYFSVLCALQSIFNLLPIYPLDGGRMLRSVCVLLAGEEKGRMLFRILQVAILLFLVLLIFG